MTSQRIDIMVDIETLGNAIDATIIQIAAIGFDIETGRVQKHLQFDQTADIEKNERPITVNGSTLKWWMNTNPDLFKTLLTNGSPSSEQMIRDFQQWLCSIIERYGEKQVYLWGNGVMFDNKLLQHHMLSLGLTYPIFHKNNRDMQTLVDLVVKKIGISEARFKEAFKDPSLTEHNAMDDVLYQIRMTSESYMFLTNDTALAQIKQ